MTIISIWIVFHQRNRNGYGDVQFHSLIVSIRRLSTMTIDDKFVRKSWMKFHSHQSQGTFVTRQVDNCNFCRFLVRRRQHFCKELHQIDASNKHGNISLMSSSHACNRSLHSISSTEIGFNSVTMAQDLFIQCTTFGIVSMSNKPAIVESHKTAQTTSIGSRSIWIIWIVCLNEKWCDGDIESIACDRVFTTIQWSMIYSISLAAPIVIQLSQQWINYNCPVSNIEAPKMIFFCVECNNWFVCVAFRSNRIENYLFCFSLALSRDWKQTHAKANTIKWNKLSRLFWTS